MDVSNFNIDMFSYHCVAIPFIPYDIFVLGISLDSKKKYGVAGAGRSFEDSEAMVPSQGFLLRTGH